MARKIKSTSWTGTVDSLDISDLEELGSEMREWYENMSENLQGGQKGQEVDEAASALEDVSMPDVPDFLEEVSFSYSTGTKGGRKGDPRWLRRDNAVAPFEAARDAVQEWVAKRQELLEGIPEDAEDDTELDDDGTPITKAELEKQIEEAEQFADDLETMVIDSATNVEFPGMYG